MQVRSNRDGRVVKAAGLRSAGAIRVGSIPTPCKGLRTTHGPVAYSLWLFAARTAYGPVAQLVERGAYTLVYT